MEIGIALRVGLLIIGAGVLCFLYFWGGGRSKNRRRFPKEGRLRQINPIDIISAKPNIADKAELFDVKVSNVEDEVGVPAVSRDNAPIDDTHSIAQMPRIDAVPRRSKRKANKTGKKQISQLEMFDDPAEQELSEEEIKERLITLYVMSPSGHVFAGESIIHALNSVGLRYGEMEIFHHYGAGKLTTDSPLFSVANMIEPGTFDMNRIERLKTPGLVFFLQLPTSLDGAVSFELFLNTAQRLTEALKGELFSDPKTALDSRAIEKMRKTASEY